MEEGGSVPTDKNPSQDIKLLVKAGQIPGRFNRDTVFAEAEIPHNVHIHAKTVDLESILKSQPELKKLTGSLGETTLASSFPVVSIVKGMTFILVNLPEVAGHLAALKATHLEVPNLSSVVDEDWETDLLAPFYYVVVEAPRPGFTKLRTRMIEEGCGEDPATGSASSALAAYLALQTGGGGSTHTFEMEQGVEMGRRSRISVSVTLDEAGTSIQRVVLGGTSVVVMHGIIDV